MIDNSEVNKITTDFIERNESFHLLFDKMNNPFLLGKVIQDASGMAFDVQIERVNKKLEGLLGSKNEDLVGLSLSKVLPIYHHEQYLRFCNVGVTGEGIQEEYFSVAFQKHIRAIAYCPEKGYVAVMLDDISKPKQLEQALRESEEKYRSLVQYSSDPIFCFNPDETYRFVNDVFAKTFSKLPEEIIGKTPHSIFGFEEAEKRLALVRSVFKSGEKGEIEVKVLTPAGKELYFITVADPIKDENGKILWVSCISKNITERMLAEQALKENERKLIQLNADKDLFISILAHDLKSPFNGLLGLTEVLLQNIHDFERDEIEHFAKYINQSAKSTYNLLSDLLLWVRSQSGKMPFTPKETIFKEIYSEAIDILIPFAEEKNISISCIIRDGFTVFADKEMFKVIIRNLVSNAIKFTGKEGVIKIWAVKTPENITFTVSDNGIGISQENIANLFDISKIKTTAGSSGEKGSGFGLLLCKEFIEKHSGRIWVESVEGKGSEFKFTIPVSKMPE